MATVAEILREAAARLAAAGIEHAAREAELLAAEAFETGRAGLVVRRGETFDGPRRERFERVVTRRVAREPLQYILGHEEFRGLRLRVGPPVLIPRPETEGVVDAVLALGLREGAAVADLGTGSGCIAVSLAVERPDLRIAALDLSSSALAVARANAEEHGVAARIEFALASFDDPPATWRGSFDAVVSNPPYVSEDEWRELAPEVRDHEPKLALVPGPTGLEAYTALARGADLLLAPGGALAVELGHDSAAGARRALIGGGFAVERVELDFQGIARVLIVRRPLAGSR